MAKQVKIDSRRNQVTEMYTSGKKVQAFGVIKGFRPGWFTKDELSMIARAHEMETGKAAFYEELGHDRARTLQVACGIVESKLEGYFK